MKSILAVVGILLVSPALTAQENDFEDFRVEFTGMAWLLRPGGTITSQQFAVDLRTDLGLTQNEPHFFGKLVLKPGRKHRILIEGIPYRLSGDTVLNREVRIGGVAYSVQQRIASATELNYVFGGYQYDFVSRENGHVGVLGGVGYMDADARATAVEVGVTASTSARAPYPLVGGEFRVYPVPGRNLLNVNGEIKGMNFGDFGRYLQGTLNAGVSVGRHITVQAGYAFLDADVHNRQRTEGVAPSFHGPVFSIQFRDR
jgi:hypothetical protein